MSLQAWAGQARWPGRGGRAEEHPKIGYSSMERAWEEEEEGKSLLESPESESLLRSGGTTISAMSGDPTGQRVGSRGCLFLCARSGLIPRAVTKDTPTVSLSLCTQRPNSLPLIPVKLTNPPHFWGQKGVRGDPVAPSPEFL